MEVILWLSPVLDRSGQIPYYLYEFTKEFLKDSACPGQKGPFQAKAKGIAYPDRCLMEKKSAKSRSIARGRQTLCVRNASRWEWAAVSRIIHKGSS